MVQIQSEAGVRLQDELARRFGPIEDGYGRKVYGHKGVAAAWRAGVLADLRESSIAAIERTAPEPQKSTAGQAIDQRFSATPPSAARAGREGRRVALAVLAASIVVALVASNIDSAAVALVAQPFGRIIGAVFGRVA